MDFGLLCGAKNIGGGYLMLALLGYGGILLFALATFVIVYWFASQPPTPPERYGLRGLKRNRALEEGGSFATIEPVMRFVARWVSKIDLKEQRTKIDQQLRQSGDYLGLTADEFIAQRVLGVLFFGGIGFVLSAAMNLSLLWAFLLSVLGAYLPQFQLSGEIERRFKEINRGLPGAADLAALCMGAGLDFVGSLRQIVEYASGKDDVIREEIGRILQELELGHTRKQAMLNFAERAPTEAVKDFASSVVQAEEKGTPLSIVLQIQAKMLRMRRSVAAEEAAARAAVQLMIPLMMIFGAIMLILIGPMMIQSMGTL